MISVVIPTCDMAAHLPGLWESIVSSGLGRAASEILFVNDGSADDTSAVVERLRAGPQPECAKIKLLAFRENLGRFIARMKGAEAATGESLLFLDTRLTLAPGFGDALSRLAPRIPAIVGSVDIDTRRSVFALYWDRSHKAIFRTHFRDAVRPIVLTTENYDRYLKGTGVFLCPKALFVEACRKFEDQPLLSDDTYLMKEIVRTEPIVIHPDLRISWFPREDWRTFLHRLWDRGPGFVEYHVFERQGAFFWAVSAGLLGLLAWIAVAIIDPPLAATLLAAAVLALAASTLLIARRPSEALKLAPLHVAVVLAFGFGVLHGLWTNTLRKLARKPAEKARAG